MAKRIHSASIYQRRDSAIRILADAGRGHIRRDVFRALRHIGDLVQSEKVETAIQQGRYRDIPDLIQWGRFQTVLKIAFERIAEVFVRAAKVGESRINRSFSTRKVADYDKKARFAGTNVFDLLALFDVRKDIGDRFNFERFDEGTQKKLRDAQDALIQQMTTEAKASINTIVMNGVKNGLSPSDMVSDIRELIGLTDTQANAVLNYRSMLETLDGEALKRQLRNTKFDDAIKEAIKDGTPLETALIERAVQDYEDNYLTYRAATIAQTESVRATNAGLRDAYRQAVENGQLPAEAVRRFWKVAMDERTCPVCLSIPERNPEGVGVDSAFDSIEGPQEDPPIHPNCRCEVEYVTDLDKVPDDFQPPEYPEENAGGPDIDLSGLGDALGSAIPESEAEEREQANLIGSLIALRTEMAERGVARLAVDAEEQAAFEERASAQAFAEAQARKSIEVEQAALKSQTDNAAAAAYEAEQRLIALEAQKFSATTYDKNLEDALAAAQKAKAKADLDALKAKQAQEIAAQAPVDIKSVTDVIPKLTQMAKQAATGTASAKLPDGTIVRVITDGNRRTWSVNGKKVTLKRLREILVTKEAAGDFDPVKLSSAVRQRTYTAEDFRSTDAKPEMEIVGTFSNDEGKALRGYKNGDYRKWNSQLRHGTWRDDPSVRKAIEAMDRAIDKGQFSKDGLLFRGVSALNPRDFENLVGGIYDGLSYLSTAHRHGFASEWTGNTGVVFRIRVQKGQKGLEYAKFANREDREHEVILPRTSRFLVHSVEGRYVNLVYLGG